MNVPHPTLRQQPRELGSDSSLIGCTDLLAEPGIPRTRAWCPTASGGCTLHLRRDGSRTTTTPSTSPPPPTLCAGCVCSRPGAVRLHQHSTGRYPPACAGKQPSGRGELPIAGVVYWLIAGAWPGGNEGRSPGGGEPPVAGGPCFTVRRPEGRAVPTIAVRAGARCSPIAGGVTSPLAGQWAARSYCCRPARAGALSASIAGGITSPTAGQWAARYLRLSSGRGPGAPRSPEASSCRLPASGPLGFCDCRPGGGPGHPDRRRRHLADCRPLGRSAPATVVWAGTPGTPIAGGVYPLFAGQRAGCSSQPTSGRGLGAP